MAWSWTRLSVSINPVRLVGTNTMASVDPNPARDAAYAGNSGQNGVLAYSGMAYAPNCGPKGSLAITGGGHADYGGNEVYLFDLASFMWSRINNPSSAIQRVDGNDPAGGDMIHGELSDGSPMAAHSYSGAQAIPGGTKGLLLLWAGNAVVWGGGKSAAWSHVCDLATGAWARYGTNAPPARYDGVAAECCCYDASRGRVWGLIRGGDSYLSYLDLATRTHSGVVATLAQGGYNPTCARVPVGDLMLYAYGAYATAPTPFVLSAIDLANPTAGQRVLTLAGDLPPPVQFAAYGFDWDTTRNYGYLYRGNWSAGDELGQSDRSHIWRITPPASDPLSSPWTMKRISLPNALLPNNSDGVYSRWRYCPSIGKFAHVTKTTDPVTLWSPPI